MAKLPITRTALGTLLTGTLLAVPLLSGSLAAQDTRPLALVHARILTMTDAGTIENGTIVVRDGRIEAVGSDVSVPPGARVVDVAGGTVMPGLVHAWSSAGVQSGGSPQVRTPQSGRFRGRSRPTVSRGGNAVMKAAEYAARDLERLQEDLPDIKARADRMRRTASYRGEGDALPVPESLVPPERQGSAQTVNVLLEEYWDVHRALQR